MAVRKTRQKLAGEHQGKRHACYIVLFVGGQMFAVSRHGQCGF
jgi:hypothetical protein